MSAARRPLRAAVIGCGAIGLHHAHAIALSSHATLVGVCDVDRVRAEQTARSLGTRAYVTASKILEEEHPEVVTIATPDHLHVEVGLEAIAAGAHVFCEKPLATSVAEARRLVVAARTRGVSLGVDYNRRFGFGYRKAQELIAAGRLGELRHAAIHVTDHLPPTYVTASAHGMLTSLLSHHIDLLRWLCGEVHRVRAVARRARGGFLVTDAVLTFELASGAVAVITGGYRDGQERTWERTELSGSDGFLVIDDVTRGVRLFSRSPDAVECFGPNHFEVGDAFHDTVRLHVQDFIARVARSQAPAVSGDDGLRGLGIIAALIEALESGGAREIAPGE